MLVNPVDCVVGLPTINVNEITLGDSLELCERIPAKTVDLILEDMPYNTTACEWDVKIDLELYWKTRLRILKPCGAIILTAREPFTSMLVMSNKKMYRHKWIWNKKQTGNFALAKIMPLQIEEDILVFGKTRVNYMPIMIKGKFRTKGGAVNSNGLYEKLQGYETANDDYYPVNIIEAYPNCMSKGDNIHPTQKPHGLFEYLIRTYTNENDLVFDGFGGSGTTAVAALNTNRNFIVIEKELKYYELSSGRLKQAKFEMKNKSAKECYTEDLALFETAVGR